MMSYFVQLLFSTSLLLLVAIAGSLIFRQQSASFRYKLWNFVMIGLLLLPFLVPLMSQRMLGVIPLTECPWTLPFVHTTTSPSIPAPYYLAQLPSVLPSVLPPARVADHEPASPPTDPQYLENLRQPEMEWERIWMMDRLPERFNTVKHVNPNEPASEQHGTTLSALPGLLLCLWVAGTVVLLSRFFFSFLSAKRLLSRMLPVENEAVQTLADQIAKRMWVYQPITLLQNEVTTVPFTLGGFTPKIVLPATALEKWSEDQLRAILTHEIAHIQRSDVWGQWLTQLVFCLYWMHPLVWFAAWQIRVTRELACDDLVLLGGEEPADFAEMLLDLANSFPTKQRFALGCGVAIFERKNIVRKRITAILNRKARRFPVGKFGTLVLLFIAIVGVTFASILSPFEGRRSEKNLRLDFQQQLEALEPTLMEKNAMARYLQRSHSA